MRISGHEIRNNDTVATTSHRMSNIGRNDADSTSDRGNSIHLE